ncbi:MAG: translation initiation factor [Puniceicoccaceae bacterium]
MTARKARIPTEGAGGEPLAGNPFRSLDPPDPPRRPPPGDADPPAAGKAAPAPRKSPGLRVEIRREKSGRGGKTVTTLRGLATLDRCSTQSLLFELKKKLGTGGAEIPGGLQLQGDCRDKAEEHLARRGFRPVRAGG